ncbi:hypothetical protein COO20_00300 [Thalassospira marina]|uniref:Uncharacterized protein n=1 Tax=Thalassospira marina TaxID=2048283 RepID=A0A2N3KYU4_9PROT|nr:hypothetical protein COO20_00300 [Thalassospira marina]
MFIFGNCRFAGFKTAPVPGLFMQCVRPVFIRSLFYNRDGNPPVPAKTPHRKIAGQHNPSHPGRAVYGWQFRCDFPFRCAASNGYHCRFSRLARVINRAQNRLLSSPSPINLHLPLQWAKHHAAF